jgi:geranylgeranylglycerol-phosphate geranylgeranyltransferase
MNPGAPRSHRPGTLQAWFRLTRAKTSMGAPLLTVAGWWTLSGMGLGRNLPQLLWSATCAFCFIAFAQVYNDLIDVELDAVSKPHRPLPSGAISLRSARRAAKGLAAVSLVCGWAAGPIEFAVAGGCVAAGVVYSRRLKNSVLVGNVLVALVSSCPFSLAAAATLQVRPLLLLGQGLVFTVVLGNELYKSAEDAIEDARHGVHTVGSVASPRQIVIALGACCAVLTGIFAACAALGAPAFAAAGTVLVLVPTARAVTASRGATATPTALAAAGHGWWQRAWMLGLLTLILLRLAYEPQIIE